MKTNQCFICRRVRGIELFEAEVVLWLKEVVGEEDVVVKALVCGDCEEVAYQLWKEKVIRFDKKLENEIRMVKGRGCLLCRRMLVREKDFDGSVTVKVTEDYWVTLMAICRDCQTVAMAECDGIEKG